MYDDDWNTLWDCRTMGNNICGPMSWLRLFFTLSIWAE